VPLRPNHALATSTDDDRTVVRAHGAETLVVVEGRHRNRRT
jgi:hypothetical protein